MPLILLLVEVVRGLLHETDQIQSQVRQAALRELQARAVQQQQGIELLTEAHMAVDEPWSVLTVEPWLTRYWSKAIEGGDHVLYAAIVDETGNVVMHSDPAKNGRRLERGWYERRTLEDGPDVVWTSHSALAGERAAYDVSAPLNFGGRVAGEYHEGLDARWLDDQVSAKQRAAAWRWSAVLGLVAVLDGVAAGALMFLARQLGWMRQVLRGELRDRARERAQMGAGLAHEIRNPLHALRINLHTLRRSFVGRSALPPDQIVATIQESDAAIDRLDGLMRDLLQFSDPTEGHVSEVDVVQEVRATLNLLAEDLGRAQIKVRSQLPGEPAPIAIDPVRLRQSLMNVLTFAQHRIGQSGLIDVHVERSGGGVEIAVEDSGPQLAVELGRRLFEPFQAPAETGSGLGLALVQVFVEEAGGRASWGGKATAPNRCRLWFPLAGKAPRGGPL